MAPVLSVVVVVHGMARELPRTLQSLAPDYQRGVDAEEYEIGVVDNGSPCPLDEAVPLEGVVSSSERWRATAQARGHLGASSGGAETAAWREVDPEAFAIVGSHKPGVPLGLVDGRTTVTSSGRRVGLYGPSKFPVWVSLAFTTSTS